MVEKYLDEVIQIVHDICENKNYDAVTSQLDASFTLSDGVEYVISSNFDSYARTVDEIGSIDIIYYKSETERMDFIIDTVSICIGTYDYSKPPANHISDYITYVKYDLTEEAFFQKSLVKNIPFSYAHLQKCATLVDKLLKLRIEYDRND